MGANNISKYMIKFEKPIGQVLVQGSIGKIGYNICHLKSVRLNV